MLTMERRRCVCRFLLVPLLGPHGKFTFQNILIHYTTCSRMICNPISHLLTVVRGVNVHLAQCLNSQQCLKCESASRRFQPGEGPSRGLLRDCTTSPINRFAALCKMYDVQCMFFVFSSGCWCIRGKIIIRNQFIPGWWLSMRKKGQLLLSPSSFHPVVSVTKLVED